MSMETVIKEDPAPLAAPDKFSVTHTSNVSDDQVAWIEKNARAFEELLQKRSDPRAQVARNIYEKMASKSYLLTGPENELLCVILNSNIRNLKCIIKQYEAAPPGGDYLKKAVATLGMLTHLREQVE